MKRYKVFTYICLLSLGISSITACSLDEELDDSVARDEAILTPEDVDPETALLPIYNSMSLAFQTQESVYALQEHSSDELMGPTRGTDWYDFGVWTSLHTHQWNSFHPQLLRAWNDLNQGITRANQAIVATTGERRAQARFLRAFLVWTVADLWGQVPYRSETDIDYLVPPSVLTRAEAVQFVIDELNEVLPELPERSYVDPDKAAAHALLAKVNLNKFVYEGLTEAPEADMQKVVQHAEAVEALGYSLAPGDEYFVTNFGVNNENSPESIFVLVNATGDNRGGGLGSRYHQTLHYNQNPSGWNGFTTIADFYNRFDPNDMRFRGEPTVAMEAVSGLHFGFLQGLQYGPNDVALTTRSGSPLAFTVEVPLTGATEEQGVRVVKLEPDFANTATPGNDYHILRYADVLLMKAEALWRMGNEAEALEALNTLRTNRGVPALTALTEDDLLDERGFELYWEGHRRTDLVRFGRFTDAWNEKAESDPSRNIFPIPQNAVDSNPNLEQNPGY